jgi:hypothetical protein
VPRAVQHEEDFETERVRHLVRQAPTGFVSGTLTVAAVVLVLWHAAPRERLILWLGVIGLLSAPAFFVVWRYTFTARRPPVIDSWRRVLIVVYGLAGAGWGALPVLLYPDSRRGTACSSSSSSGAPASAGWRRSRRYARCSSPT